MNPRSIVWIIGIVIVILILAGCKSIDHKAAIKPKYDDVKGSFAEIAKNHGRFVIYRMYYENTRTRSTDVLVNGEVVWKSQPREFLYFDRPEGSYEFSSKLGVTFTDEDLALERSKRTFKLNEGETIYIEMSYRRDQAHFTEVQSEQAKERLKSLSFGGM